MIVSYPNQDTDLAQKSVSFPKQAQTYKSYSDSYREGPNFTIVLNQKKPFEKRAFFCSIIELFWKTVHFIDYTIHINLFYHKFDMIHNKNLEVLSLEFTFAMYLWFIVMSHLKPNLTN